MLSAVQSCWRHDKENMSYTANLRRQHDAILDLIAEITGLQAALETREHATAVARRLAKLTGVVQVHLAAEDKALYPRMMASSNSEAAEVAGRFTAEMGGLAKAYLEFESRWRSASDILDNAASFRKESQAVFAVLAKRIERENIELYPLADAIASEPRRAA